MAVPMEHDDEAIEAESINLIPIDKLNRELRALGSELDRTQARGLVDLYYRWQKHRIALQGQIRAAVQGSDPGTSTELLSHFVRQVEALENQAKAVLQVWASSYRVGEWSMAQHGIGPIIAAGLIAHIDIAQVQTAGAIWRFGGYDPNLKWHSREEANQMVRSLPTGEIEYDNIIELAISVNRNADTLWRFAAFDAKGNERRVTKANLAAAISRRPFNADLKVLFYKIGDSFLKTSNSPKSFYGKLYRERKQYEVERNLKGGNAEAAAMSLASKNVRDPELREILESGRLPAGQIDARARRYAVKIFLSHWFEVAYRDHYKIDPPAPFAIAQLGHAHYIPVPEG